MRIRRNAGKILGTASCIPWQPRVVTEPAHVSTARYNCQLNRSPWDVFVFPSPPPTPSPSDEPQEMEECDEMRGEEVISMVTRNGMPEPEVVAVTSEESSKEQEKNIHKRKPPVEIAKKDKGKKIIIEKDTEYIDSSTMALSTSFSSNIAPMQEEEVPLGCQERGMQEHDSKSKPALKKFQKSNGKSTIMEKEVNYVENNGLFTCKKTDGKQWQCKRPADQPNSFCNYHIVQHRSYNKKAKAPTAVTLSICNQTERKTAKTPSVVDISSYPALVPWRGTRQVSGGIDCIRSVALEATTEQSKTEDILECDVTNVKATAEQSKTEDILECDISNVTHQEDILETSEEEEKPKRKNANPVSRRRKRRRKLVKVRSLESLM